MLNDNNNRFYEESAEREELSKIIGPRDSRSFARLSLFGQTSGGLASARKQAKRRTSRTTVWSEAERREAKVGLLSRNLS